MQEMKEVKVLSKDEQIKTLKQQIKDFEFKLDAMQDMFLLLKKAVLDKNKNKPAPKKASDKELAVYNKDSIPLNSTFIAYTQNSKYPFILCVDGEGSYHIGEKYFDSLSQAAEFASGVRRSGWTFWRLMDGRTLKEVYKDK